ncbi:hypothetical protein H1R16_09420 [Marnyiella aurantia]|uniref:Polymerase beta nucleotidyltransferase domain-containing protein n=1 Tax=Marnyiella aurantia TaxID=2758037 RepID=A0A7D7RJ04_9FLAO|nr:hypothetical protein [Marnyiella aurantia]MBA5246718.1 hypothetical protein [Marnyiella aurantia]QMS97932.1 hypothetical protein H1R16_09420 [Marnyiella aurantia]
MANRLQGKSEVIISFIFGSIAKGSKTPNDCDLFIVTILTPMMNNWDNFIDEINQLKTDFENEFNLKLNATIYTKKEFLEYSAFKERVLNRPMIEII